MGHAATATNDFGALGAGVREFSAFLRLRQGGAARATWLLTEAPGGTMISVGTDAACDWQIRAAFVPPRAFSVLVVGGRAFIRSGQEPGLLVNGKPVDDNWNPLPEQARIDIGLARFEILTGYADMMRNEPLLELAPPQAPAEPQLPIQQPRPEPQSTLAEEVSAMAQTAVVQRQETRRTPRGKRRKRTMETQEYAPAQGERSGVRAIGDQLITPPAAERPATKIRNSTIELRLDELDYVGTIPHPHGRYDRTGEHSVAPSLLESDEVTRVTHGSRGTRYVMAGMLFASAYSAWIYLLDRL